MIELLAAGIGSEGTDVLEVQLSLDHVLVSPSFVHAPDGQKLVIEFALHTAKRAPAVFVVGSSSLQRRKGQVALALSGVLKFQGFTTPSPALDAAEACGS